MYRVLEIIVYSMVLVKGNIISTRLCGKTSTALSLNVIKRISCYFDNQFDGFWCAVNTDIILNSLPFHNLLSNTNTVLAMLIYLRNLSIMVFCSQTLSNLHIDNVYYSLSFELKTHNLAFVDFMNFLRVFD